MAKMKFQRRGVGLIELLIALSISAVLLTATAVAVDASFKAYANNQEEASLLQQSRMALNRVVTSIRTSDTHAPIGAAQLVDFKAGLMATDSGIAMIQEDGTDVLYRYDAAKQQLIASAKGKTY